MRGLKNLLADLEKGGGQLRISMTDESASSSARTSPPRPARWCTRPTSCSSSSTPSTEQVYRRPLVIIPPWINKYYILDLREKNSFIRWAVQQGHTVFVLLGEPGRALAQKGFEDYMLEGPLAALDAVEKATGANEVNFIGYCLGGTLLGATLAYLRKAARPRGERHVLRQPARLLAAGRARRVHRRGAGGEPRAQDERARLPRGLGDGRDVQPAARERSGVVVRGEQLPARQGPVPFDLLYWNADSTRMPARMHSFYLRNMYIKNLLGVPGGIELDGVPIDLSAGDAALVLHLHGRGPHRALEDDLQGREVPRGPVRFVLGGSGHIAGIVNPPAAKKYHYWTNDACPSRPTSGSRARQQHRARGGKTGSAGSSRTAAARRRRAFPARALRAIEDARAATLMRIAQKSGSEPDFKQEQIAEIGL